MAIRRLALAAAATVPVLLMMAQPAAASWLEQGTPVLQGVTDWQLNAVSCTSPTSCMAVGNTGLSGGSLIAEQCSGTTWALVNIPGSGELTSISCTSTTACEAVGDTGSGLLAERWDGTNWTIQTTPVPAGATSSQLSGVSCTSPTACEAVGEFSSGGTAKTLAEVWDGSSWTIQATANPGQASNGLLGVSCLSATACEAVGSSSTGPTSVTLAEARNGSNWAAQTTPNAAIDRNRLDGVSCTSATACMAVGTTAARWNGTYWAPVTIAQPKGDAPAELDHVSCTDRNHCMAAGSFFNKEAILTLVAEHWNGTKWKVQATPISSPNDSSFLTGVSCTLANSCTAVGAFHNGLGHNHALVEDWSLRWQDQSPVPGSDAIASDLTGASCVAFNACAAVGGAELSGGSTFASLAEIWDGHTWTAENTPNAGASNLAAVACTAATSCTAVGNVLSGGGVATLAEHWDGTSWTVQTTPSPAGVNRSFLLGVSCTAANACTAVGFFDDSAGNQRTLAERWNGTNWTTQTTPNPSGSTTSQLNEVSCSSATACTAVGSASGQTWAEAWNGTTWTIQNTPIPAGGSDPALHGVSCTAPNACTAVGSFFNGSNGVPLAERWNGTKWTPQTAAVPAGSTAAGFSSVSCVAAKTSTACNAVGFNTGDGSPAALAETWNGKTWSVPDFHGSPISQTSDLSGVSCSSLTACMSAGASTDTFGRETPLAEQYS